MIGIVVLNYMSWQDSIRCIESISATCSLPWHVLMDNASPNESVTRLEARFSSDPRVSLVIADENRGYAAGNNLGTRRAIDNDCETIFIANSDILFHEGSLEKMRDCLTRESSAGIVGPRVRSTEGADQWAFALRIVDLKEKYLHKTALRFFIPRAYREKSVGPANGFEHQTDVFYVSGCCFGMSRQFATSVLPLDENTFLGEEELILGIRAQQAGFRTIFLPDSEVTHHHRGSKKHASGYSAMQFVFSEIYYCHSYLHEHAWRLLPLWLYRVARFACKSLFHRDYRRFLARVVREGWIRLISDSGLGIPDREMMQSTPDVSFLSS